MGSIFTEGGRLLRGGGTGESNANDPIGPYIF